MIDLTKRPDTLRKNIAKARAQGIVVPTLAELRNPELVPEGIRERLSKTGIFEIDPVNLFRITWKNEPKEHGGLFGAPNFIELPSRLTGVKARIVAMA
ncbi:MAG: pyridoxal-5-phosphate-dependent protein subunit beta, partial [Firmicutes bacterium]|nr:pyridoxal-5-phosphate-dependent protein subunit beta [Bacillota bacterium]